MLREKESIESLKLLAQCQALYKRLGEKANAVDRYYKNSVGLTRREAAYAVRGRVDSVNQ